MKNEEHQGWTNYETFIVALWMENERTTYEQWKTRSIQYLRDAEPKRKEAWQFGEEVKEWVESKAESVDGFMRDLLNGAIAEVNWNELGAHWLSMGWPEISDENKAYKVYKQSLDAHIRAIQEEKA